jgi:hypothetical protein
LADFQEEKHILRKKPFFFEKYSFGRKNAHFPRKHHLTPWYNFDVANSLYGKE